MRFPKYPSTSVVMDTHRRTPAAHQWQQNLSCRRSFGMPRILRGHINRWRELRRFLRFGLPKVDSK
jgi:hypothetical protein